MYIYQLYHIWDSLSNPIIILATYTKQVTNSSHLPVLKEHEQQNLFARATCYKWAQYCKNFTWEQGAYRGIRTTINIYSKSESMFICHDKKVKTSKDYYLIIYSTLFKSICLCLIRIEIVPLKYLMVSFFISNCCQWCYATFRATCYKGSCYLL